MSKIKSGIIIFPIVLVIMLIGYVIYLVSKLIRALGYILLFKFYSALDEFDGFWGIESVIDDISWYRMAKKQFKGKAENG